MLVMHYDYQRRVSITCAENLPRYPLHYGATPAAPPHLGSSSLPNGMTTQPCGSFTSTVRISLRSV